MKSLRIGLILLMAALVCFSSGCAAIVREILSTANNESTTETVTLGEWEGNTYTNDYFDISMDIPEGWTIMSREEMEAALELGKEVIRDQNEELAEKMDLTEIQTLYLAFAIKPATDAETFSPNIQIMAENLNLLQGLVIKTGEDYLTGLKDFFLHEELLYQFDKPIYSIEIDGVSFDVLDGIMEIEGISVEQRFYSTVMKGYVVNFVISYSGEEQATTLEDILATVQFKQ